jgi:hypothetical protein
MEKITEPAANRSIKDSIFDYEYDPILKKNIKIGRNSNKPPIPCRYLNITKIAAYKNFRYRNKISYKTFHYLIEKKIKKPHKDSDLCEYCQTGKTLKKKIINFMNEYEIKNNLSFITNFDTTRLIKFFEEQNKRMAIQNVIGINERVQLNELIDIPSENRADFDDFILENERTHIITENNIIDKLNDLQTVEFHQETVSRQRKCYNNDKKIIDDDTILIQMDYKQKIVIGMGPKSQSHEYYEQKQISILGFALHFIEKRPYKDNIGKNSSEGFSPNLYFGLSLILLYLKPAQGEYILQKMST